MHALRVLQEVEQMAVTLSDFAQGVRGQVRIAANTSSLTQFLPEDLAAFMEAHPAVCIDLEEQNSNDIVTAVQENRADIGIFADRTPAPGLVTAPYRGDELVLIVPQRHPLAGEARVAFADTLAYDYVGLPPATSLATRLAEESGRLGRTMQLRIQVRSFDAICRMVAATGGVGILPRLAAEPHARSMPIRLIALADDWASRRLLLGVRDADAAVPAAAAGAPARAGVGAGAKPRRARRRWLSSGTRTRRQSREASVRTRRSPGLLVPGMPLPESFIPPARPHGAHCLPSSPRFAGRATWQGRYSPAYACWNSDNSSRAPSPPRRWRTLARRSSDRAARPERSLRKWRLLHEGTSVWWEAQSRNKQSVCVDLRQPEGQDIVRLLAREADVLIENFRPGTLEKWGLSWEALHALNPRLIAARVRLRPDRPQGARAGFAAIGEAMAGLRYLNRARPRAGARRPVAGRHHRRPARRAGRAAGAPTRARPGEVIDAALYESLFNLSESLLPEYSVFGAVREPAGAALPGIARPTPIPAGTATCSLPATATPSMSA